jgi:DNA-binding beta-propeller fold protein YncE
MKTLVISMLSSLTLYLCAQEPASLKLTKTIVLAGVKGRFDHFAIDAKGHRLLVAALGNNTLEIVDVAGGKRLKSISGLRKPTGVLFLSAQNQIGVANGDDGTFKLFDGASYELVKTIPSLDDADNLRLDANKESIYAGFGDGGIAVIDVETMKKTGSIKLAAHPESFQLQQQGNRIFVNVPDARQIAVIDREKQSATAFWPMEKFQANFPMALDEANKRLFVGCRKPARLLVLNTDNGNIVSDIAISGDTDDLFYDPALKRVYVACGEGFIDVVDQVDPGQYRARERIPTRNGARTSFFSPDLNELYLAVPQRGQQSAEIRVFRPVK